MNNDRLRAIVLGVVLILAMGAAIALTVVKVVNDKEIIRLRNEIATKDSTLEIQNGLYTRLSQERADLRELLDGKDLMVSGLLSQIRKGREELLTVNQLVLKWKKAYESTGAATQVEISSPLSTRKRVDFSKNFGSIGVNGWTLTDPPEYKLTLEQLRPIALTLAVSQDADGAWHSYVSADDDNTATEIKISAVNPYLLKPHWYQRLRLHAFLAGGENDGGFGVLAGAGIGIELGKFELGPVGFVTMTDKVSKYLGLTLAWRPF